MAGLTPVTLVLPNSLPLADREALLAELAQLVDVQRPAADKDLVPAIGLLVVLKDTAGIIADASAVALLLYKAVTECRKRGIALTLPLRRPNQPDLQLDGTQSVEEIAAWLRQHSR